MIDYPIPGTTPRRSIRLTAYGSTIRLQFSWHERPKAWFVAEVDADGAPLGPERIMSHALMLRSIRDNTGTLLGQLAVIDFNRDGGAFKVADLGARLRIYGFSKAEIDAAAPASKLPTIVSVTT